MGKQYKVSSLISFQHKFATEQACIEYLALLRWPDGYRCSKCGCQESYQLRVRPRVFMCSACNHQESVTADTILHRTKLPLLYWFWAAYLLIQDKRGISAKQLSRELNLRYATAWTMLHKLRRALFEKQDRLLSGVVEADETYYGGKGGSDSGGRSMQNNNKCLIVMALERKPDKGKKAKGINNSCFVAGNAKVAMADSASAKNLGSFLKASLAPGTNMLTDGWAGYIEPGKDFVHEAIVLTNPKDAGIRLPLIHIQFANLKSWIAGTFHGVSPKHLPSYLQEWNYRFNRRGIISNLFGHLIKRVVNSAAVTYKEIVQGVNHIKPADATCG